MFGDSFVGLVSAKFSVHLSAFFFLHVCFVLNRGQGTVAGVLVFADLVSRDMGLCES